MPRSSTARKTRNFSLQPDHELAVQFLREEAEVEHVSPVVQELIEREMFARFGREWRVKIREWAANRALEAIPA